MMNTENALKHFVMDMEVTLYKYQKTKGDSWNDCDLNFLEDKLKEEIQEYQVETKHSRKVKELVDIANVCMMLYHRHLSLWAKEASNSFKEKVIDNACDPWCR